MYQIRAAILDDAAAIADIYNHAIEHTTATFDTEKKTIENRIDWLKQHHSKYPVLVATIQDEVIAFASLSKWSERAAYDDTAEISIYITPSHQGNGLGKKLLKAIVEAGKTGGLHVILSRITQGNDKSIYLHQLFGFEVVGILKEVGIKFGKRLDVTVMQMVFKD
jgi:L-amino acid N-acyltransferase YncA